MNKRILTLAAMMLLSLCMGIGLRAQDTSTEVSTSGKCGDNIEWTLTDDRSTLTLTGSGPMYDYDTDSKQTPWWGDDIKTLIIGEGITTIGDNTFLHCGLTQVSIASTVTSIGCQAFWGRDFTSITLPASLTTIKVRAFSNCASLERIDIPAAVTQIATGAFTLCSKLSAITVDKGNKTYTSRDNDGNEANAIIDRSTHTLVLGCKETGLEVKNLVRKNIIPEGVTTIGDQAFEGCKTDLFRVILPNTVTSIGKGAFSGCSVLNTVELGTGISNIGENAFSGCNGLRVVVSNATTPPTCGSGAFPSGSQYELQIPSNSDIAAYKESYISKNASQVLTINARLYATYDATNKVLTFYCNSNTDVYATDKPTVYELPEKYNSENLKDIREDVTKVVYDESIQYYHPTTCEQWFYLFKSLKTIEHLNYVSPFTTKGVTSMRSMFYMCTALESLDLSKFNTEKVEDMSYMFSGCKALKSIDFGKDFTTANVDNMSRMFEDCTALASLDLSLFNTEKVTSMKLMFVGCPATIYVGDLFNTTNIKEGEKMFSDGSDKAKANYITGHFMKKVGTLGTKPLGAKGESLTIAKLDLSADADYVLTETAPVTAAEATYIRKMSSKWGTLCLPYAIEAAANSAVKFYTAAKIADDVITLNQLTGTIAAGTPVLFYTNGDVTFTAKNVALAKDANTQNQLVGTYITQEVPSTAYFIAKDAFHLASAYNTGDYKGVKAKGFRAYLQPTTPKASLLRIAAGDTTGIDGTVIDDLNSSAAEYYNIDGTRTDGLHRGLNIVKVGGKTRKVMVK